MVVHEGFASREARSSVVFSVTESGTGCFGADELLAITKSGPGAALAVRLLNSTPALSRRFTRQSLNARLVRPINNPSRRPVPGASRILGGAPLSSAGIVATARERRAAANRTYLARGIFSPIFSVLTASSTRPSRASCTPVSVCPQRRQYFCSG